MRLKKKNNDIHPCFQWSYNLSPSIPRAVLLEWKTNTLPKRHKIVLKIRARQEFFPQGSIIKTLWYKMFYIFSKDTAINHSRYIFKASFSTFGDLAASLSSSVWDQSVSRVRSKQSRGQSGLKHRLFTYVPYKQHRDGFCFRSLLEILFLSFF